MHWGGRSGVNVGMHSSPMECLGFLNVTQTTWCNRQSNVCIFVLLQNSTERERDTIIKNINTFLFNQTNIVYKFRLGLDNHVMNCFQVPVLLHTQIEFGTLTQELVQNWFKTEMDTSVVVQTFVGCGWMADWFKVHLEDTHGFHPQNGFAVDVPLNQFCRYQLGEPWSKILLSSAKSTAKLYEGPHLSPSWTLAATHPRKGASPEAQGRFNYNIYIYI